MWLRAADCGLRAGPGMLLLLMLVVLLLVGVGGFAVWCALDHDRRGPSYPFPGKYQPVRRGDSPL